MTTKKAKLSCPECGKNYDTAKGMSTHRRYAHGMVGMSKSAVEVRAKKEQTALTTLPAPVPLVKATKVAKFKCPECGEKFENSMRLGLHRRNRHKVKGSAKGSLVTQKQREIYMANYKRDENNDVICPECNESFKEVGITFHRKGAHNLSADAQKRMFENNKTIAKIETVAEADTSEGVKCPHCVFVAKNDKGLRKHVSAAHQVFSMTKDAIKKREERNHTIEYPPQVTAIEATNGHRQESHPVADGHSPIPDAALAVALGRFQGLCASFSAEYDLPPRMFAARLAELIYNTQVRQASRAGVRLPSL